MRAAQFFFLNTPRRAHMRACVPQAAGLSAEAVRGVGVGFTACTPLPCTLSGAPLYLTAGRHLAKRAER